MSLQVLSVLKQARKLFTILFFLPSRCGLPVSQHFIIAVGLASSVISHSASLSELLLSLFSFLSAWASSQHLENSNPEFRDSHP